MHTCVAVFCSYNIVGKLNGCRYGDFKLDFSGIPHCNVDDAGQWNPCGSLSLDICPK